MQKIDLHQDIALSFANDISQFKTQELWVATHSRNAWWFADYKKADLQVAFTSIWPYTISQNPDNPWQSIVKYDNNQISFYWQKHEQLRKENNVKLILNAKDMTDTKFMDFGLNFVYHLKWWDGITGTDYIDKLYQAGIRSIQLVWEFDNKLANCNRTPNGWISEFSKDIISYMDQKRMIIDTANMNHDSMTDVYKYTKNPIMNSHTNIKTLYNHSRNVSDDFLELVARDEWIIGLSLQSDFIWRPETTATIDEYMDQIQYVRDHVSDDQIAFGSWYHGIYHTKIVKWLENIEYLTVLEEKMVERFGYKFTYKFFRENAYRFIMQTL